MHIPWDSAARGQYKRIFTGQLRGAERAFCRFSIDGQRIKAESLQSQGIDFDLPGGSMKMIVVPVGLLPNDETLVF
jgi:hypothetical protein